MLHADPDDPNYRLMRAMLDDDPGLRATLQDLLGMQPWPYDDLVLRTPHCPWCGARATLMVGTNVVPMAMCPTDECPAWNWDPTVPAKTLIENAREMVVEEQSDGTMLFRPEETADEHD